MRAMTVEIEINEELIERLAALEHDQWCAWATDLSLSEKLSKRRVTRWHKNMCPYEDLPKEVQEFDRVWARKVINVLRSVEITQRCTEITRDCPKCVIEDCYGTVKRTSTGKYMCSVCKKIIE